MMVALGALTMAMFASAVDSSKWTSTQLNDFRVAEAAESATTLAATNLWNDFNNFVSGEQPQINDFRFFMDSLGIANQDGVLTKNLVKMDYRDTVGLPMADGKFVVDGIEIENLEVHRVDQQSSSHLVLTATATARFGDENGSSREYSESVQQVFLVEPPDWEGLNFALLANNINCLMCHTDVDRAERFYNDDDTKYGTFERVKLASIESFHLREDPESSLAGTLYIGGDALGADGTPLSDWNSVNFKSRDFDADGLLIEDTWGDLTPNNFSPAPIDPDPFENLYMDYAKADAEDMVDGYMPSFFPPPFPDDGGYDQVTNQPTPEYQDNRIVDKNEFMSSVAHNKGTLTGGTIGVSPSGTQLTTQAEVDTLIAGTDASLGAVTTGNVYLHGTDANPIVLNGDIGIDGDLIISGVVKGKGTFKVSGNVYVPSDLTYPDGTTANGGRSFGYAADGTPNAMALASGGNVMVGDPYHPAWGMGDPTDGTKDESFNFLMEEMAIFNRMEWMKTQPTLPGKLEYMVVGQNTWEVVHEIEELVEWEEEVPIMEMVKVGEHSVDDWDWVVTGQHSVDDWDWVVVGQTSVDDWGWVVTGVNMIDDWDWVVTGQQSVDDYGWVVVGQTSVDDYGWILTGNHQEPVYDWVNVGSHLEDDWGWVLVGSHLEPDYDWVQVGSHFEDVWGWVVVLERPPEYGGDITEWQVIGQNEVPDYEWQIVSYHSVDDYEWQVVGNHVVQDWEWQVVGYNTVDDYTWGVVGSHMEDDYEWQVVGSHMEDIYEWQVVGSHPEDILEWQVVGSHMEDDWDWQIVGSHMEDTLEWQVVGSHMVDDFELQQTGVDIVQHSEMQFLGNTWTEYFSEDIYDWVVPDLPNKYYMGAGYIPRYYGFKPGSPIPVFNKDGYFDGTIWHSEERAGGWDDDKLTYADINDNADPLLFDGGGSPIAVVSTVTPSGAWISDDLLRGLIKDQQAARDDTTPLALDGTFYSSNGIFGLVPKNGAPGMNGELLVNGAIVAADVGLLAPNGTQLNYDPRGRDLMKIRSNERLIMRRQLWAPSRMLN